MMKKFILGLALLLVPQIASAQTLSGPSDTGTYVPSADVAIYASGSTLNVLGDGSDDKGGTAPAFTTIPEPADPTDKTISQWVSSGWVLNTGAVSCLTNTTTCPEKKIRTQVSSAKVQYDDPIRYFGQPGVSHCHEFFGNEGVNSKSTRQSIRYRQASTAAGGPAWSTGYWEPCWTKTISSKKYAIPAAINIVYYAENGTSPMIDDLQHLHLKLRFIVGVNTGDPLDCGVKNEIDKANGGAGTSCTVTSGRYQYRGNGFNGYICADVTGTSQRLVKGGGIYSPGFTLADGGDPWEGRCLDGDYIYAEALAPQCWNGVNVSSPTGYSHFRQAIYDNVANKLVCPNHWYKVPAFLLKTMHKTRGPADYMTWTLDSDAMVAAKCTALGQSCVTVPGFSFHADWINGISKTIRDLAFGFCLGIGTNVPHQCEPFTISATNTLLTGNAPDNSRVPQLQTLDIDSNDPTKLTLIGTSRTSTHNMKGM